MNPSKIFQDVTPVATPNPVRLDSISGLPLPPDNVAMPQTFSPTPAPVAPIAQSPLSPATNSAFSPSPIATPATGAPTSPLNPVASSPIDPLSPMSNSVAPNMNQMTNPTAPTFANSPAPVSPVAAPTPPPAKLATPPTARAATANIADAPLMKTPIETPRPTARNRTPWLRDIFGLAIFVAVVVVGAWLINLFVFRTFNVLGPSMEPTLYGGAEGSLSADEPSDRLVINLLPVTGAHLAGKDYIPKRGQIVVFKNPNFQASKVDEYVVKRVVGLPGERVTVDGCHVKIYNSDHPDGFDPYPDFKNFASDDGDINPCIDGDGTDITVPDDAIFVIGDHRTDGSGGQQWSMDSRNGNGSRATLGTIPLKDIIGPVSLRIWPFDRFKMF